ncbi:MAG: hypothetical protein HIU57_08560 [Acidobacteria bacterium]|nr:hypothetical protein [Acidobacteriota bacterium]
MFEAHKEKKAAEAARAAAQQAQAERTAAMKEWTDQMTELQNLLAVATGERASDDTALMLKKGEVEVAGITNVGLIEERKGAGQWKGASQGVSFPIGHVAGRTVRYRVGQTRGHYVQGSPVATAVDTGTLTITNQRIVYQGSNKSAECAFPKLLGIQHGAGALTIAVSNRQKPTVVHFGELLDDWVSNRLTIALALFNGDGDSVVSQLRTQIAELDAKKPTP